MQLMDPRRKSLSDVPESSKLPSMILERSPLLDRRASNSISVFPPRTTNPWNPNNCILAPLKTISERAPPSISRSQSVPFNRYPPSAGPHALYRSGSTAAAADHAQFRSSPQYRVNPVVKFDERLLPPERMNYGIAGYNTSRSGVRSSSGVPVLRMRPRSVHVLRVWTRRLRVRMIRVGVRSACSRLMMRFRRLR